MPTVSCDFHATRFELAVQLKDMRAGYELAKKAEVSDGFGSNTAGVDGTGFHFSQYIPGTGFRMKAISPLQSEVKWKQLADLATGRGQFGLAMECLHHAEDYGGLLLLATSAGDVDTLTRVGKQAATNGHNNVAFISNFLLGQLEVCLEILITSQRLPEAAFFARTYLPSQISRLVREPL